MANELNIEQAVAALIQRAVGAMHDVVAEEIFPKTQEEVPKGPTRALADTGRVSVPDPSNTVTLSYGNVGDQTGIIAIVQHERLDYMHPRGGKAKYVEGPVNEAAGTLTQRIAARM